MKNNNSRNICILNEHYTTIDALNSKIESTIAYEAIHLNGNGLEDNVFETIAKKIKSVSTLEIADNNIRGSCLSTLLAIPGLKKLVISDNPLDADIAITHLSSMPQSSLETLILKENQFDFFTLLAILSLANESSKKRKFCLNLGELKTLDDQAMKNLIKVIEIVVGGNKNLHVSLTVDADAPAAKSRKRLR